nr:three-finger toxin [Helicops leopardinus]
MKTLLLSLVVVALVYLDSGHTITCHSCKWWICWGHEICSNAPACYTKRSDPFGLRIVRGCATDCIFPASGEKIEYCAKDKCN